MLPDGNSPPDVFFLLLFVQSFSTITSDTSPHQMSVLSFPLKKLTDDGPDTGNYYVRTVTANFNHNVPCERGSKSNEQAVRLRAVREPWAVRRCRGGERGPRGGQGAGGSTSLPLFSRCRCRGWAGTQAGTWSGTLPIVGALGFWFIVREGLVCLGTDSPSWPHLPTALPVSGLLFSVAVSPGCGFISHLAAPSACGWAPGPSAGLGHAGCIGASHHVLHMKLLRDEPTSGGAGRAGQEGAAPVSTGC